LSPRISLRSGLALTLVVLGALAISGCGRRGPTEAPPKAATPASAAVQEKVEEDAEKGSPVAADQVADAEAPRSGLIQPNLTPGLMPRSTKKVKKPVAPGGEAQKGKSFILDSLL
jgi:predicted small lipoprotein YifL